MAFTATKCWTIKHYIVETYQERLVKTFIADTEKSAFTQCYLFFNIMISNGGRNILPKEEGFVKRFLELKNNKEHMKAIDHLAQGFRMKIVIGQEAIYHDDSCDDFIVHITPELEHLDKLNKINDFKG